MEAPGARKDPTIAVLLSLCLPGAGFAYLGDFPRFLRTLAIVGGLFCLFGQNGTGGFLFALAVHVFTAISAGGAARLLNERLAATVPPPPPLVRRADPRDRTAGDDLPPPPPPPPPPPRRAAVPSGPPLSADEFLAEIRAAWTAHRSGEDDAAAFSERKRSAIERVRAADVDEGVALLEATSALVGAGVMSPAERTRLQLRVTRP